MSFADFFKPPMYPDPEKVHVHLAEFSATGDADKQAEIGMAIHQLNRRAREYSASGHFTKTYLALIGQAEAHAEGKEWPEAHRAVWEATFLLNRALESSAAGKFRLWMCIYYACWLLFLVGVGGWMKHWEVPGPQAACHAACSFGLMYWRYVLMGALGGLTIAIWGLVMHSSDLDFDRSYTIWYWLKPVLGAVMGLIAVLTARAGLIAISGEAPLQPSAGGQMVLYVLAFLAGFSERFFLQITDRVMTALLSSEKAPAPTAKPAAPKRKG
jgi:hypothetical protein